jgi:hypothetical protein
MQGENAEPKIKETPGGFIPWKYDYSDLGREAYVYYFRDMICDDPRVSRIECFRLFDTGTADGITAEACFAVFYDDPFYNVTQTYTYTRRSGGDDALSVSSETTEHVKYQTAVQDVMPVYNPDDFDLLSCDCRNRALRDAAFPNIGLYVWVGKDCVSKCNHAKDNPLTPFYKSGDKTYDNYRKNIIYISDYNCATRFDRAAKTDPVDHTVHNDYPHGADGPGGSWLSPPTYSTTPLSASSIDDGDRVDLTGRLVTSGGNVLYVWDQYYGRLEFNLVTGEKITRA